MPIPVKIRNPIPRTATDSRDIHTGDGGQGLSRRGRREHNLHMNEGYPTIRRPENLRGNLVEVCCSQYLRAVRAAVDQMFYDTAKESCTIWMVELANGTTNGRRDRPSAARMDRERPGGVTRERTSDYEPVDKVPFPNSSRMIRERSVQFLRANETWLRSIIKADCS